MRSHLATLGIAIRCNLAWFTGMGALLLHVEHRAIKEVLETSPVQNDFGLKKTQARTGASP